MDYKIIFYISQRYSINFKTIFNTISCQYGLLRSKKLTCSQKLLFEITTISHGGGYFKKHSVCSQQCHDSIERWPFVSCCLWCVFSEVQLGLMVSINYFWDLLVMTPEKSWLLELELLIDSSADVTVRQPPLFWVLKTLFFHYCFSGSPQCHQA